MRRVIAWGLTRHWSCGLMTIRAR